ncbi:hypothetical protein FOL47_000683 [Perkinsus chesapeaki]|uniref:C3H1-type domain-containing protein n=1 Tax=Perkinsus chesapeaki TaxID=330153 RepID=A0A7J6KUP2_PERCH|nr:hypothetical protein FOL47_000683 [Perkinsus chesapeaki]
MPTVGLSEGIIEVLEKHCDRDGMFEPLCEFLAKEGINSVLLLSTLRDNSVDDIAESLSSSTGALKDKEMLITSCLTAACRDAKFQVDIAEASSKIAQPQVRNTLSVKFLQAKVASLRKVYSAGPLDPLIFPSIDVVNKLRNNIGAYVNFKKELFGPLKASSSKVKLDCMLDLENLGISYTTPGEADELNTMSGSSWLACFSRYILALVLVDTEDEKKPGALVEGGRVETNIDFVTLISYMARISDAATSKGWSFATAVDDTFRQHVATRFLNGTKLRDCFSDSTKFANIMVDQSLKTLKFGNESNNGNGKQASKRGRGGNVADDKANPPKTRRQGAKGLCYSFLQTGQCHRGNTCKFRHEKASNDYAKTSGAHSNGLRREKQEDSNKKGWGQSDTVATGTYEAAYNGSHRQGLILSVSGQFTVYLASSKRDLGCLRQLEVGFDVYWERGKLEAIDSQQTVGGTSLKLAKKQLCPSRGNRVTSLLAADACKSTAKLAKPSTILSLDSWAYHVMSVRPSSSSKNANLESVNLMTVLTRQGQELLCPSNVWQHIQAVKSFALGQAEHASRQSQSSLVDGTGSSGHLHDDGFVPGSETMCALGKIFHNELDKFMSAEVVESIQNWAKLDRESQAGSNVWKSLEPGIQKVAENIRQQWGALLEAETRPARAGGPIRAPLMREVIRTLQSEYPARKLDHEIFDLIDSGAPLGTTGRIPASGAWPTFQNGGRYHFEISKDLWRNYKSVEEYKEWVIKAIQKEKDLGRMYPIHDSEKHKIKAVTKLACVPTKTASGEVLKVRLVDDMRRSGVNGLIEPNLSETITGAAQLVNLLERVVGRPSENTNLFWIENDVRSAFRLVPLNPEDRSIPSSMLALVRSILTTVVTDAVCGFPTAFDKLHATADPHCLGYVIHLNERTISIPRDKVRLILEDLSTISPGKSVKVSFLSRLTGRICWAAQALVGLKSYLRPFYSILSIADSKGLSSKTIRVNKGLVESAEFLKKFFSGSQHIPLNSLLSEVGSASRAVVMCDASDRYIGGAILLPLHNREALDWFQMDLKDEKVRNAISKMVALDPDAHNSICLSELLAALIALLQVPQHMHVVPRMFRPLKACQRELRKPKRGSANVPSYPAETPTRNKNAPMQQVADGSNIKKPRRGSTSKAVAAAAKLSAEQVENMVANARSQSTLKSHASIKHCYMSIMNSAGRKPYPLSAENLAWFVTALVEGDFTYESVTNYVRTIRLLAREEHGEELDLASQERVRLILRAASKLCRQAGVPGQKRAMTFSYEDLIEIANLDEPALEAVVCGILLGVGALLRVSELLSLAVEDCRIARDESSLSLLIRKSKVDQRGAGSWVTVGCCCPNEEIIRAICPLHRVLRRLHCKTPPPCNKSSPELELIFPFDRREFIKGLNSVVCRALGGSAELAGYSGHSLRRSGAQLLFHRGVDIEHIVELGRWASSKSLSMAYLRDGVYAPIRQQSITRAMFTSGCFQKVIRNRVEFGRRQSCSSEGDLSREDSRHS